MAKDLKNLIRLHEWQVDEKRLKLAGLLQFLDDLQDQARRLEEEVVAEQRIAAAEPGEAGFLYGKYAEVVIQRRHRIAASIFQAEEQAAAAREELNQAYRDLKKYEAAEASRLEREQKEADRKDQNILDEVGMQSFVRRRKGAVR